MNKRITKRAAAVVTAAMMLQVFSPLCTVSAENTETTLSVVEITEKMGIGWNLGNSLDAHNSGFSSSNIKDYETQWSNPIVTKELIDAVQAKGFNTVRIPVTWYQHISSDGSYTIDEAWMKRVKEVVDYAYNNGMYVILNVHHETWINRADFSKEGNAMEAQLRAVWNQIAAAFADYDQRLIFEGMNEPREVGGDANEWVGNEACYNVVNRLNDAFVDTVRSVESPYRQTRMLMVPDYAASRESYIYSYLTIPKASGSIDADSDGDDDYVAVSLHAYSPFSFAMGDGDHSDFSTAYETELESMFSGMQAHFLQEGVPIVLGEFSASNYGYDDARIKWAEAYMRNATEYGIPCVLWDNNKAANNGGEAHGYINRDSYSWYSSGEKVVDTLISARRDNEWGIKTHITYPMYAHNDYSTGTYVPIGNDGVMKLNEMSGFESGREFAIKYNGDALPEFAIANSSWGGWTTFNPYDFDKDNKIAYFSYDQIMKTWNTANGSLANIKLTNIANIGFGGITLIDVAEGTVDNSLKIRVHPYAVTVTEGGTAAFKITAAGSNISYRWQVSSNGTDWSDISGAVSSSLSVTAVLSMNGYKYRCIVTDGTDTITSKSAVLTVKEKIVTKGHNAYDSGTDVSIATDGVITLSNVNGFGAGKEFAIKFNGSTVPEIGLMTKGWGGWKAFEPYEIDWDNGIAYVSYDQIMKNWNTANGTLAHVKVENIKDIGFVGVRLLDIPEKSEEKTIEYYINIVNGISSSQDVVILTDEQMEAVERVLEYDLGK